MSKPMHPDNAVLIRHLDGELADDEWLRVDGHLTGCAVCRARQDEFRGLSEGIETVLRRIPAPESGIERARLAEKLAGSAKRNSSSSGSSVVVLRRFGWGMAIAASLALAVLVAPVGKRPDHISTAVKRAAVQAAAVNGISVNGETFIALPYSDPSLPVNTSHVVEMQVPVAALTEAGVAVQPAWNGNGDGMVAANVLLGIDGQPLGIDVLGAE